MLFLATVLTLFLSSVRGFSTGLSTSGSTPVADALISWTRFSPQDLDPGRTDLLVAAAWAPYGLLPSESSADWL